MYPIPLVSHLLVMSTTPHLKANVKVNIAYMLGLVKINCVIGNYESIRLVYCLFCESLFI